MSTELLEKTAPFHSALIPHLEARASRGPQWLREMRARGLAVHAAAGVPTTRHEEWKYTNLKGLTAAGPWGLGAAAAPNASSLAPWTFGDLDQVRLVFVNGRFSEALSTPTAGVEGLEVRSLGDLVDDSLAERLDRSTEVENHPFAGLNSAAFEDGALVRIAKNAKLSKPVHVLHVAAAGASFPRLLVLAEEGSDATVIETYASAGDEAGFTNAVTEIYVAPNAHIEHVKVQRENVASFHIALTGVRQERDSAYNGYSVTFGGALTRNDLNVFLAGSNIHSRMDGVYALGGDQVCDNHTRLDHAFPHCDSFEVYKGILDDQSTGVFNGKIFVHQDAQKTDAKQTNQALLLSPHATINTKPQLEIFADDVKCTHGATVGQLREDAMFYLRSRGIGREDAEALLVYAFASEVLEKISIPAVREGLELALYQKLGIGGGEAPAPIR